MFVTDRLSRHGVLATVFVLLLLLAACGGGTEDGTGADETAGTATEDATDDATEPEQGVAGCGPDAWVDPSDLSEERSVARCESGSPEPDPLEEEVSLTVSYTSASTHTAPIFLAADFGEFEKENLDVTLENVPPADALSILGQGRLDAAWTAPTAAFYNALDGGFNMKWVTGNFYPRADDKTGLWAGEAGQVDPDNPSVSDLEGGTIASGVGEGSVIMYPIQNALREGGLTFDDVDITTVPFTDMPTAVTQGAVDAAWVLAPYWGELEGQEGVTFLVGQPPKEPLGGLIYGPTLVEDNREAGVAFVRALIRTINTYLPEGWHEDAEVVEALAQRMDSTPEAITSGGELVFDWEIRGGTSDRFQEAYLAVGSVEYTEAFPESEAVDRSFYAEAVGHEPSGE